MTSRALSIVEEFVRSPEAEDRKNAAAALAALGQSESVVRLIGIALAEKEPDVRKCAEAETLSLKGEALHTAVSELYWALDVAGHREQRINAHGILGRLRANGVALTPPRLSLLSKFRLAFSLHRYLYHPRRWRFRARAWKWGLLGGLFGVIICAFLSAFIARWEWDEDSLSYLGRATLGVGISFASSIAASQRSCPINLQLYTRVGGLVDALLAVALSILVAPLITALTLVAIVATRANHWPSKEEIIVFSFITVICAGLVGVIRAGTIIGCGLFRNRLQNKLAQTVIGIITVLLLMVMGSFFLRLAEGSLPEISGEGENHLSQFLLELVYPGSDFRLFWLVLIPAVSGVAYTFASIDSESFPARQIHGRMAKIICYPLMLVFSALLIFTLYLGYRESKVVLTGHQDLVSKLVFSPDSRFLVVGAGLGKTKLWEIDTLKAVNISLPEPRVLDDEKRTSGTTDVISGQQPSALSAIVFSPDGKLMAMIGENGLVLFWDTEARRYLSVKDRNWLAPDVDRDNSSRLENVSALAFSIDSQTFVSGHKDGRIRFWETRTMIETIKKTKEQPLPVGGINSIVFRPGGRQFVAVALDGIYFWDFEAQSIIKKLVTLTEDVRWVEVLANGKLAAWGTARGEIKLWDLDNDRETATLSVGPQAPYETPAISADGRLLAIGGYSRGIKLWDTITQRQIAEPYLQGMYSNTVALSPDGKYLAVGGYKIVRMLDITKWTKP